MGCATVSEAYLPDAPPRRTRRRRCTSALALWPAAPQDAQLAARQRDLARIHLAPRKGVDAAPATRYVEHLEVAYAQWQRRVDDQMVAGRLEAQHRAQQEQRRPSRPGLRTTGGRVLDRRLGHAASVAGEGLGKPAAEVPRRVKDSGRDARSLAGVPVTAKPPGDQGIVVRPDGAHVIADGVVPLIAFGHGTHAPPGEEARAEKVLHKGRSLLLLDDAAPKE